MNQSNDYITIGKVLKPRGLAGEIKVQILTNKPQVFADLKTALGLKVLKRQFNGDFVYLMLDGVTSVEAAEKLRGRELKIQRKDMPLDGDEILSDELIGFQVFGTDGKKFGVVKNVETFGTSDVLDCGSFMFPYEDAFVTETDMKARKITVRTEMLDEETVM